MRCNTGDAANEHTIYWYPGDLPNSAAEGLPLWTRMMTRFGNYLFDQDLVTEQTFTGATRGQLTTTRESEDPVPDSTLSGAGTSRADSSLQVAVQRASRVPEEIKATMTACRTLVEGLAGQIGVQRVEIFFPLYRKFSQSISSDNGQKMRCCSICRT